MRRPINVTMCSFCGKSHAEVKKLIAGPGVYICDNCTTLCKQILDNESLGNGKIPHCNFCGQPQKAIRKLIDLSGVYTCNRCNRLRNFLQDDEPSSESLATGASIRRPRVRITLLCSFCGKSLPEVENMIAGPGVCICNNCTTLCKSVLDKELLREALRAKVKSNPHEMQVSMTEKTPVNN